MVVAVFGWTNILIAFVAMSQKSMKCLLCSSNFDTEEDLVQRYINFCKVDENNKFFQKLFQLQKKSPIFRKCLRCNDFITQAVIK